MASAVGNFDGVLGGHRGVKDIDRDHQVVVSAFLCGYEEMRGVLRSLAFGEDNVNVLLCGERLTAWRSFEGVCTVLVNAPEKVAVLIRESVWPREVKVFAGTHFEAFAYLLQRPRTREAAIDSGFVSVDAALTAVADGLTDAERTMILALTQARSQTLLDKRTLMTLHYKGLLKTGGHVPLFAFTDDGAEVAFRLLGDGQME
jgi:hypothetical protein